METVAGEKPLKFATSLMVTASDLLDGRFTIVFVAASSGISLPDCNGALCTCVYSAGTSNESGSRNPRVFQAPKRVPATIQLPPAICAGLLRFSHSARQSTKPRTG